MPLTSEWVSSDHSAGVAAKVRSNRFLADVAAIRRGEARGDTVWQAYQRERAREKSGYGKLVRLKPREFGSVLKATRRTEKQKTNQAARGPGLPARILVL